MTRAEGVAALLAYCVENRIGRPDQFAPEAIVADHKRLVGLVKDMRKDLTQVRYLATTALETLDLAVEGPR